MPELGERVARLEADGDAAKRSERDLWTKLNEYRESARGDIAALSAEYRKVVELGMAADKERAVANAAFIARADALLERVGDCVRRQDTLETDARNYRTANDDRWNKRVETDAEEKGRQRTIAKIWAAVAGLVGAGFAYLLHKISP